MTLAATGQLEQARAARAAVTPLRPDFFYSILATFRAMAVIAVGDRPAAQALVAELLPVKDMLAGAASISLVMQPVAQTLGELSVFLGRPEEAAGHFAVAEEVARRWNAPHWIAAARSAAGAAATGRSRDQNLSRPAPTVAENQ